MSAESCDVALVTAWETELVMSGTIILSVMGFVPGAWATRLIMASFVPFIGRDKIAAGGAVANAINGQAGNGTRHCP